MSELGYGRIVVCNKQNSSEGAKFFEITSGVTTFGRCKESDIRIKIDSVSRQHAQITIDENGNVSEKIRILKEIFDPNYPNFSVS